MRIMSAASAFPANRYSQEEISAALKDYWAGKLARPELLDRVHARAGVRQRYLALPFDRYYEFRTFGETNAAWLNAAEEVGSRAAAAALERAELAPSDVTALYVVSTTGMACPSLDARLINRLGFRPQVKRTPIFGLGCVGGATALTRATDYVRAYPEEVALVVAAEFCSLTIQREDFSTANVVSTGLFGDGAGAAVLGGAERPGSGPTVVATRSTLYPETEELMGWRISEKGFAIVLSPRLPDFVRSHLADDVDSFLAAHELSRADVDSWVIHPGGPKVLQAIAGALGIDDAALEASWECLARCGNISSASVLAVLEEVMENRRPARGRPGLIMALGPGFCSELLLLRW